MSGFAQLHAQVLDRAPEDVAQDPLVGDGKRRDRRGRLIHDLEDPLAQLDAGVGERERLHPAVALGATALDELARLEPVDDARYVGGTAEQALRQRPHRQWAVRVEQAEGMSLRERQPEVGQGGPDAAAVIHADLEEQLLGLLGGGETVDSRCHNLMILESHHTCHTQVSASVPAWTATRSRRRAWCAFSRRARAPSTESTSRSPPARSTVSSAPTAPESRRRCT